MGQSMSYVPGPSRRSRQSSSTQRLGPSPGCVEEKYDLKDLLGEGSYGRVYDGYRKADGKQFAIKSTYSELDSDVPNYPRELPNEVAMMTIARNPPSPLLIKLHEWFLVEEKKTEDGDVKKDIVLVMEHPGPCRTLEDFLKEKQHMEERDARTLILQIVKAAQECLRREICHWDIHEDNILVIGPPLQIKLIDFGQGTRIGDRQVHQWPGRRISFKEAVKITVNQLYYLMKEMAKHCSSIPAEFMRFMATCWSPVNAEDQIQHTVEEILNQPWLKD